MGEGAPEILDVLRGFARARPLEIGLVTAPREELRRRLLAGADLLLAPARFGPGGLEHLRALRYGALPIARRVGAFVDTIREFDVAEGTGNGFLFVEPSAEDLLSALDRALAVLRHPEMRRRAIENAMATDVSWRQPAVEYIDLYKELINKSIP
jgi:starch synthase